MCSDINAKNLTGWYRDGYCNIVDYDHRSRHTVCALMTDEFLLWARN